MNAPSIDDTVAAYEKTSPIAEIGIADRVLRYHIPNKICLWRVQTLLSKEPDTIAWLNTLPDGGTLLDIGANVGMYSIYAGVLRNARIFAFEPEAQNYALLCKNLLINKLGERATAWCAALSNETKFDRLYLSSAAVGSSTHSFGEQVNAHLQPTKFPFAQGCVATTVDRLIEDGTMPVPNFIKIDVDGLEHKIIAGAAKTLENPAVQSLLVELNSRLPEHVQAAEFLAARGFRHDPDQFEKAQRKDGFFKGVGECIFRR